MACNNCNLNKCGCNDSYLTTPPPCPTPSDCPDIQPCSEVFDAQCVVYTGDDIICDPDTVVSENDTIDIALNKIVEYFCNNVAPAPLKEIFYQESANLLNIGPEAPGNFEYFFPTGYNNLTYTNNSGIAKTYKIHASFQTETQPVTINGNTIANQIDGGIIRTIGAVDDTLYETDDAVIISGNLLDGPFTNDIIDISGSIDKVLTSPPSAPQLPVEFRFGQGWIRKNNSIFYLVTLNDGESVSLKFATKDTNAPGWLTKAQILVEEF